MQTMLRRVTAAVSALLAIGILVVVPMVSAQTGLGQGLEIAPPLIDLKANPGQVLHPQIRLRNITPQTLVVTSQYNDFVAAGEEGTPKLLLKNNEQSPYSIKGWLSSIESVSLAPQEQKTITVTINVPGNASPGGHYGVVRFTGAPPEADQTAVSLSASVGTLMLVTVSGNVKESAQIAQIYTSQNKKVRSLFEYGPVTISTRVQNTGNIHIQPTGTVTVNNMLGRRVANFQLNQNKGNVLPQSVRRFDVSLNNKLMFGRYKVMVDAVYGSNNTITSKTAYFWVIPYKLIILVLAAIAFIIFMIRRYNRLIVKRAQKGSNHDGRNKSSKKS